MPDPRVADLLAALDAIAPFDLAAEWDNVGLLAGKTDWPARRVRLAIDLTDSVAREALRSKTDALVIYHPPIFKGINSITDRAESPTALLPDLLAARVSIISLHTALDAAAGGTNDLILDTIGVADRQPLEPMVDAQQQCKLVVFVPEAGVAKLRAALSAVGAGVIGHYRECSFELPGRGTFLGDETTRPTVGTKLHLETVDEVRMEMVVPRRRLAQAIRALYANHSYEEPAFDIYPIEALRDRGQVGMGRLGQLPKPLRGDAILAALAKRYDLSTATAVGDLRRRFNSVIAAAGSFGVKSIRDREALFITGEMKHHDALELLRRGVSAVCLGHYASERPVLDVVAERLKVLRGARVEICRTDAAPLRALGRAE